PEKPLAPAGSGLILAQSTPAPAPAKSIPVTAGPPLATGADFTEPVMVRPMWGIALAVYHAANPPVDEKTGKAKPAIWPRVIGDGIWPKMFAIAVFLSELGGGLLVLIGLFTRLGAFLTVGVMIGAMWLTQFGPAIQSGNTRLGFFPAHSWLDMQ